MQRFISELYPNNDRDFSYVFGYAARHVGYLGKSLNQGRPEVGEFIRTISWLLALANKIGIDLESAMVSRHPGICPYCVTRPCQCISTGKKPAIRIAAYNIPEELNAQAAVIRRSGKLTFTDHANRLAQVYIGNAYTWRAAGPWLHTSKMQEELAEVHEAATRFFGKRKELSAVGEEFADLIAWVLSAWRISFPADSLDEAFISFYLKGCPVCGRSTTCSCQLFADRSAQLVEPEKLKELEQLFLSLAQEVGANGGEIEEIRKSLIKAAETQSEPIARSAVLEVKKKTKELEDAVDRGAKNARNVTSIVQAIWKIFEGFPFIG